MAGINNQHPIKYPLFVNIRTISFNKKIHWASDSMVHVQSVTDISITFDPLALWNVVAIIKSLTPIMY